jgi:hypothetical protein
VLLVSSCGLQNARLTPIKKHTLELKSITHQHSPTISGPTNHTDISHVILIVMENLGYSAAMDIPSLRNLADRYAYASSYYAVAHPSLPNYIALISGSTQGITSDCWFCYVTAPTIAGSFARRHVSWGAFMQGLPAPCWLGPWWPEGDYAGKHNPFRYFMSIRQSSALCSHIDSLSYFVRDIESPDAQDAVPQFSFVVPNLCNDGHDCSSVHASSWLVMFVNQIRRSKIWNDGTVIFVTWDEGNGADTRGVNSNGAVVPNSGGGHVLTLVITKLLKSGCNIKTVSNHYSLLKTIEEMYGLPLLGSTANANVHALFDPSSPRHACAQKDKL